MTEFIRKNMIVFSTTFTPKNGGAGVPSSAEVAIVYTNTSGATARDVLPMTLQSNGSWMAMWDSSLTPGGLVQWMAHCAGGLVGSDEGSFTIRANKANTM